MHFVWDMLLDQVLPKAEGERAAKGSFPEFFRIVVDGLSAIRFWCARLVPLWLILGVRYCRVTVRFDVFSRTQVLGLPDLPKGAAARERG